MPMRVAINGFGRIGRNVLRAFYESGFNKQIQIVAINDLGAPEILNHLFQFDSTHGKFNGDVALVKNNIKEPVLQVNGDLVKLFQEASPEDLPWAKEKIDIVLECSGQFTTREGAFKHISAGAGKVIIGAPSKDEVDKTIVYGVNDQLLTADDTIISMASCTTNCMAPVLQELDAEFDIVSGFFTTIHSYSNNQKLVDGLHKDPRRARSATQSLIPTSSGAIEALEKVLPELRGKVTGYSMRVPTLNVAAVDITLQFPSHVSAKAINQCIRESTKVKNNLVEYNELPLVSRDFYHNPASAIFDATQTRVINNLVKIVAWYDNEWGYANRLLDVAQALTRV